MNHRAALLLDRGVIQVRLGNNAAALQDYSGAIALDSKLGDAMSAALACWWPLKLMMRPGPTSPASSSITRGCNGDMQIGAISALATSAMSARASS